jgi:N-succinyldiaminopimelate aminotransferase
MHMNPLLAKLHPYPFERLRALTKDIQPNPAYTPISLGIGEPKHPTPDLIKQSITDNLAGLASYPATAGDPALRKAIAGWVQRRYSLAIDPATQVLPVSGSREALFALAQTVIDPTRPNATVVCPNPFYQIYEGAALLAGAQTAFVNSDPKRNFAADWASVPEATWATTQLLYVCSPGNPTGAVMPLAEWQRLFALSDKHGFVIASDECYSEIYFRDEPPVGSLEAATKLGRDFHNLIAFTSLSKRSNVPGMRSGFVAGDAAILKQFLLYRTYHGSAMNPVVQQASIAAWNDEVHVVANRDKYRAKFAQVTPVLAKALDVALPDAGFYLWADVSRHMPDDVAFAQALLAQYNVTVLPGSLLAREANGVNPGAGRIRLALVAEVSECLEAAHRIASFVQSL